MSRVRSVCIVTPGALGSNPRVVKEADALQAAGFDVHVICVKPAPELEFRDVDVLVRAGWTAHRIDLLRPGVWPLVRARQLAARAVFAATRWPAPADTAFSAYGHVLSRRAMAVRADHYVAHYPAALPAAAMAARRSGATYAFDAEDFHQGDWPADQAYAFERAVLRAIERKHLSGCAYVTASSDGIAEAYAAAYGAPKPTVVLNVFPRSEAPAGATPAGEARPAPSVYWFSQTIGPDRGLECAVRAIGLSLARPHLFLRGSPAAGFVDRLRAIAADCGAEDRLHVLEPAPPSQMARCAAVFDLALSGEPGHTANNALALGNKLFTYLLGGVPIALSDTPAHRAFQAQAGAAAQLFPSGNAGALAACLDDWLLAPDRLATARALAYRLGQDRFNWDIEQARLVNLVANA